MTQITIFFSLIFVMISSGKVIGAEYKPLSPLLNTASAQRNQAVPAINKPIKILNILKTRFGSINFAPSKKTCGAVKKSCKVKLTEDSQVILIPNPKKGYTFNGWSGDCLGTQQCSLLMDGNKMVGAVFVPTNEYSPIAVSVEHSKDKVLIDEELTLIPESVLLIA